jgi:hypothetical protein
MNHYLITIVLMSQCITCDVIARNPFSAITGLIEQIGKPKARVSSLTCKVIV